MQMCATPAAQNYLLLHSFGKDPVLGDIGFFGGSSDAYANVLSGALAPLVKDTCEKIAPPK